MKNFYPNTPLSSFIPMPYFMLTSKHSVNAKFLYALLLHRTMLSQKNGWADEAGNVYVIYTVKQMAEDLGRGKTTVYAALIELEKAGLLLRVRQGRNKANRLYLLLPDDLPEVQRSEGQDVQRSEGQEVQDPEGQEVQKADTSNIDREYKDYSKKKGENPRRPFGEFENVFLSGDEYAALQADFPDRCDAYIQRLSRYMAANDRHYANHCAVLRKWLDEDDRGKTARNYTYEYSEGECL